MTARMHIRARQRNVSTRTKIGLAPEVQSSRGPAGRVRFTPTAMPAFMFGDAERTPCSAPAARPLFSHNYVARKAAATDQAAKEVCRECPFRALCLRWAVENDQKGVWGGTTDTDRAAQRRKARGGYSAPGEQAALELEAHDAR